MKNYILGILIAIVVVLGCGIGVVMYRKSREKPEAVDIIKGSLDKTPWSKAKVGQWAIYAEGGSSTYHEVTMVSGSEIEGKVFNGTDWYDSGVGLIHEQMRFTAVTTEMVIDNLTMTRYHPCIMVLADGREIPVKCECTQYVRQGIASRANSWYCGAIPFRNGKVYSRAIQGDASYVNFNLMYFGKKPPDTNGKKFKAWMKKAWEWKPEEVKDKE